MLLQMVPSTLEHRRLHRVDPCQSNISHDSWLLWRRKARQKHHKNKFQNVISQPANKNLFNVFLINWRIFLCVTLLLGDGCKNRTSRSSSKRTSHISSADADYATNKGCNQHRLCGPGPSKGTPPWIDTQLLSGWKSWHTWTQHSDNSKVETASLLFFLFF